MKSLWKIAAPAGAILLCGAAIVVWHVVKNDADNRKVAEVARACRARAEHGDAEAQFTLGGMYYAGKGVPQDYAEATRWYRKAAEQGYAKAEYDLGFMYCQGKGVAQDYSEAIQWYRRAADQGVVRAQHDLGYMYYKGQGVPQDYAEAARWYRKAADQGYARAQDALGSMYYQGKGVQQDFGEAARWYRKAATQGDEFAQRALGFRKTRFSTGNKIRLAVIFFGSILLLIGAQRAGGVFDSKQRVTTTAGLLGLSSVGLGVYRSYLGFSQSVSVVNAFYFADSLLVGACVAMYVFVLWPRGPKTVLRISALLFISFIGCTVYLIAHYHVTHPGSLRLFFCTTGLWIGMSIPSAVLLWLDGERTRRHPG